ncbi:acyl-CoA dehydrogenase family protein [Paraburkholderia susongensis]|uniref:Dibenzothiophene monooxygenase n=1 Tax=Paraburkholderia susongensis TaxID=1515439 RepID=A0A1X7I2Y5_9BURK|nr:acyl-CoA dehydrogenase family protein [Paraburkholderia susongensis]SMG08360.1 Acyl-CoA dehydrogenase [Paraburkholderia susongensis]
MNFAETPSLSRQGNLDVLAALEAVVQSRFPGREREYHDAAAMPFENLQDLFELGLLTATVRKEHGGLGSNVMSADPATFLQAMRRVARVSPGTAHCMQVQNHVAWALDELGTDAQRERFVKPMTQKMSVSSFVGSEAGRKHMYVLKTTAKKVDGGYVVNGNKNYATNGYENGVAIVFATIEGETEYFRSHLMVIVEPGMEGLTINHDWYRPTGMRVCPSPEIYLNDVFIDELHVLGEPGVYPRGRWQGRFHLGFTANYLGMIEGAYEWVRKSLVERGRGKDPFVQLRMGEARTQLHGAQIVFENAIDAWRTGDVQHAELISMQAKSICAHAALQMSHTLIMLAGSTALFDEFPLARLIRDLNTHILHVGHDKTAQIVGAAELGESFDSTLQR